MKQKLTKIYEDIFSKMGELDLIEYGEDKLIKDSCTIIGNTSITFKDIVNICEAIGFDNIEIADYDEIYIKKIDLSSLKRCNLQSPDELDFIPGRGLRLWWD